MLKSTTNQCATLTLLLLSFILLSSASPLTSSPSQNVLLPNNHDEMSTVGIFRDLHHRDLPAITTILVEAFLPSAMWKYVFPNATAHKREIWTCYRDTIESQWPYNHTRTAAKVIAVPHHDEATGLDSDIAVAFAVWNIRLPQDEYDGEEGEKDEEKRSNEFFQTPPFQFNPLLSSPSSTSHPPKSCPHGLPPTTNLTRALSTSTQFSAIEAKFFSPATYPRGQLYLNLLATHPAWDGHGFAARHVQWGKELASSGELDLPVTLLSSPAGFHVYDGEGFRSVSNVTVARLDGEEGLWFEVMDYWEEEKGEEEDV